VFSDFIDETEFKYADTWILNSSTETWTILADVVESENQLEARTDHGLFFTGRVLNDNRAVLFDGIQKSANP
jgi:hypothetical protein